MTGPAALDAADKNTAQAATAARVPTRPSGTDARRGRGAVRLRPSRVPARPADGLPGGAPMPPRGVPMPPRGGGQPLAARLQREMEGRFGADFSQVRVHTGGAARASAAEFGARAYTVGDHVVFGTGETDKRLLAHELAHVLQQRAGQVAGTRVTAAHGGALKVSHPHDVHERAAEVTAARVTRAGPGGTAAGPTAATARRQPGNAGPPTVVQRELKYESYVDKSVLETEEGKLCHQFALKVSAFTDQAYDELIRGRVADWEGAKIATFLRMLLDGDGKVGTWAGNAIEERVYVLMLAAGGGERALTLDDGTELEWTPQFSESMGGASFPDVVIHLPSGKEGLVDITSDPGHILGKAGGWGSKLYMAEAVFPSITVPIANQVILPNIRANGVGEDEVKAMLEAAEKQRKAKEEARAKAVAAARAKIAPYKTKSAKKLIDEVFKGNRLEARKFLLEHGLKRKGILEFGATKRRKTRKLSAEAKQKKVRDARREARLNPPKRLTAAQILAGLTPVAPAPGPALAPAPGPALAPPPQAMDDDDELQGMDEEADELDEDDL